MVPRGRLLLESSRIGPKLAVSERELELVVRLKPRQWELRQVAAVGSGNINFILFTTTLFVLPSHYSTNRTHDNPKYSRGHSKGNTA